MVQSPDHFQLPILAAKAKTVVIYHARNSMIANFKCLA